MSANHGVGERICFPAQHKPVSWIVRWGGVFDDWIAMHPYVFRDDGREKLVREVRERIFGSATLFDHERLDVTDNSWLLKTADVGRWEPSGSVNN